MSAIKKTSLVDQVYEKLKNDIVSLRIPFGSRINVNELTEELGVSCTPIREAINRLQQDGLVTYKNNTGASTIALTAHDMLEIQQVALALQCEAVRLAMDIGDRDVIISCLEKHTEQYRNSRSPEEDVQATFDFFGTFYRNCGNKRLDSSMISIQAQQVLLRNIYANNVPRLSDISFFESVLEAVKSGDTATVQACLRVYSNKMTALLNSKIDSL